MRFLIAILVTCLATSALACTPPSIVIQDNSNAKWMDGDTIQSGELRVVFDNAAAPSDRDIMLVDMRDMQVRWLAPGTTADLIMTGFGIENALYTGRPECNPGLPNNPDDIPGKPHPTPEELPPGRPPIELFPGVEPRSGLWQGRLGTTKLEGCPPSVQQIASQAPGTFRPEWMKPRRLTFKTPFHPDQLELTRTLSAQGTSAVNWRYAGEDSWRAEILQKIFNQIPGAAGQNSKMTWTLTIKSATKIEHVTVVNIVLPEVARALLGAGEECRLTSLNWWERVGE